MKSARSNALMCAVVAAAAFLAAGIAAADPVIVNGSFEAPAQAKDSIREITLSGVPGWSGNSIGGVTHEYIVNGNVQDLQGRNYGTTPFGSQYLGLNAIARRSFRSIESQSVAGFVAGARYALTIYFANLDGAKDGRVSVVASDGATGSGPIIASNVFSAPQEGPYGLGVIDFIPAVLDFTAISNGSMTFSIGNNSLTGTMGIDNVSLAALAPAGSVPEPTVWAMLISGFGVVGIGQRRRRRPMTPSCPGMSGKYRLVLTDTLA